MLKHFVRDLQSIKRQLLKQFGTVEKMISDATQALCEREVVLARQVIDTDEQVNVEDVRIEEECLKILALHQPVATDLRQISAILKINSDIERIADLACNIAERAECVHQYAYFPLPDQINEMARRATEMVGNALDAFVNLDEQLAKQVIKSDSMVDQLNREVIEEIKGLMRQDSTLVDPALHCFSATRHLERIADHAENIAEDVIYLVNGEIVRHNHQEFLQESKESQDASNNNSGD